MLSLTAISGSPTSTVLGSPGAASTSTSTATASMPSSANVLSLASIGGRRPRCESYLFVEQPRSERHVAPRSLSGDRTHFDLILSGGTGLKINRRIANRPQKKMTNRLKIGNQTCTAFGAN